MDTLFESVRVYGDIDECDIHHMWYGHYSYGHLGGVWTNNLMHGKLRRVGEHSSVCRCRRRGLQ